MLRSRLLAASALVTGAAASSQPRAAKCAPVPLASSASCAHRPTAVLVHGLDSSRETWVGTSAALASRGYPSIAFDLRGHGESALGDEGDFSARALAEDVLAAIRAHGIQRAVLVGHQGAY